MLNGHVYFDHLLSCKRPKGVCGCVVVRYEYGLIARTMRVWVLGWLVACELGLSNHTKKSRRMDYDQTVACTLESTLKQAKAASGWGRTSHQASESESKSSLQSLLAHTVDACQSDNQVNIPAGGLDRRWFPVLAARLGNKSWKASRIALCMACVRQCSALGSFRCLLLHTPSPGSPEHEAKHDEAA